MLRLRLLGPIDAALDGRPVALGPTKQRAVLAILALHVNRTVPVDRLIEGLWGDEPPPSAPKMVQLYVSQLRRLLNGEGPTIVTRGRGYELCSMEDGVDAARFERLVANAAEQGASPNGAARAALALWRGPPLADVVDEPFAAAQIRRLEELHLRASELAIEGDLAAGRHREVIGELDALVAAHPLSERLHAQRMLALYRSGRQAEALEAYSAARRLLVQEIGVEPGPDLRALQQAVLRHDPALAAQPGGPAAANGRPATPRARTGRRRRLVALAGALVVVLAVGMVAMTRPSSSDLLAGIDENAVGVLSADAGGITAQYPVGRGPSAISAGGGSVWIANALDGTVSRIEPAGDRVATIHVDGTPAALAFARGSLWVADGDGRTVAQVDPGQNKVIQQIDARSRRQIGFYGWQTDYVGPSGFIQPAFTCGALAGSGSAASNVSRLCDRSLERRIERAQATVDAGAARAWAAADHRIVDLAPVVPLTNHRAVLLVSKRVGNVQGHLQSLALLDQFWVR